jgi:hypothetical protein
MNHRICLKNKKNALINYFHIIFDNSMFNVNDSIFFIRIRCYSEQFFQDFSFYLKFMSSFNGSKRFTEQRFRYYHSFDRLTI